MIVFMIIFFVLVNGGLSFWSSYTSCSKSCGGGVKTRTRTCTNPAPNFGGADCFDVMNENVQCNTQQCPSKSFVC